jgi:hypothetical protein
LPHLTGLIEGGETGAARSSCTHARRQRNHFRGQVQSRCFSCSGLAKLGLECIEVFDEPVAQREHDDACAQGNEQNTPHNHYDAFD